MRRLSISPANDNWCQQQEHLTPMSGRVTEEDLVNEAQDVLNDTVEVAQALKQKDQNKADGEGAGAQAAVKGALEAASSKAAASYTAARDRVRQAGSTAAGATQAAVEAVKGAAETGRAKAAQTVAAGKEALGLGQEEEEEGPPPQHDEVDATPEEQAFRHPFQWEKPPPPGVLHRVKESAVHAAEGVKHRIEEAAERLPLICHHAHQQQGGGQGQQGQQLAGEAPSRMAKVAEGRPAGGKGAGAEEEEEEEGQGPPHDEVDASPEELFVRHSVRWPSQQQAGPGLEHPSRLQRLKDTAVHAAEGVKHRIEGAAEKLPLIGHHAHQQQGGSQGQQGQQGPHSQPHPGPEPAMPAGATAEQRTGEPLHMAKAAEGRNEAVDNPVDHAVHAALRPEAAEREDIRGMVSDFPETLDEAIKVAQVKGEDGWGNPGDPSMTAASSAAANVNPFSAGPRSKL